MNRRQNDVAAITAPPPGPASDWLEIIVLAVLLLPGLALTLYGALGQEMWRKWLLPPWSWPLLLLLWYVWRVRQFRQAGRWQQFVYWHKLELGLLLALGGALFLAVVALMDGIVMMWNPQRDPGGFGTLLLLIVTMFGAASYGPIILLALHVPVLKWLLRRNHLDMPLSRALRLSLLALTGWLLPPMLIITLTQTMVDTLRERAVMQASEHARRTVVDFLGKGIRPRSSMSLTRGSSLDSRFK